MDEIRNKPVENVLAEDALNRQEQTPEQVRNGIPLKSQIVSPPVNDYLYQLAKQQQYTDFVGGYYSPTTSYDKGNIVKIIRKKGDNTEMNFFLREGSNVDIKVDNPPILNATVENINGVLIYTGGDDNPDWLKLLLYKSDVSQIITDGNVPPIGSTYTQWDSQAPRPDQKWSGTIWRKVSESFVPISSLYQSGSDRTVTLNSKTTHIGAFIRGGGGGGGGGGGSNAGGNGSYGEESALKYNGINYVGGGGGGGGGAFAGGGGAGGGAGGIYIIGFVNITMLPNYESSYASGGTGGAGEYNSSEPGNNGFSGGAGGGGGGSKSDTGGAGSTGGHGGSGGFSLGCNMGEVGQSGSNRAGRGGRGGALNTRDLLPILDNVRSVVLEPGVISTGGVGGAGGGAGGRGGYGFIYITEYTTQTIWERVVSL